MRPTINSRVEGKQSVKHLLKKVCYKQSCHFPLAYKSIIYTFSLSCAAKTNFHSIQ